MNNSLQSPLQVINTKSKEGWSGCIEVLEPKDASVNWHVYLLQGKIQYICPQAGKQARLNYLWQQFKLGSSCPKLSEENISEYVQLCQWLEDKQLSTANIKKLIFMFVKEGIIQVLSIKETSVVLKPAKRINKSIIGFELKKLYTNEQINTKINFWRQARKYFTSPISRLYLEQKNALKFYKIWKTLYTEPEFKSLAKRQKLSSFVSLFVAKSSLYEIATKSKVDISFLVKHLQKTIEEEIVDLLPFNEAVINENQQKAADAKDNNSKNHNSSTQSQINSDKSLIACVDDSKTVQKQVKMTLEAAGYEVIGILDPTQALKTLSQHQPSVIFLDINMPNINGYDLCTLLRKSHKFKEIPIVMLTGRDGMIDRVRAKIAGSTDYLTKPCDPNKLIQLAKVLEKTTITAQ